MSNFRIRTGVSGSGISQSFRPNIDSPFVPGIAPSISFFEVVNDSSTPQESLTYNFMGCDLGVSIGLSFGSTSSWSNFTSDLEIDDFSGIVHFPTVGVGVVGGYNIVSELRFATGRARGLVIDTSGWTLGVQAQVSMTVSIGMFILDISDSSMVWYFFAQGYVDRLFSEAERISTPSRIRGSVYRQQYERGIDIANSDLRTFDHRRLRRHIVRNYFLENPYDETNTSETNPLNIRVREIARGLERSTLCLRMREYLKRNPARCMAVRDGYFRFTQ